MDCDGTLMKILDDIDQRYLIRLNGASGSGKSTIMNKIVATLNRRGISSIHLSQGSRCSPLKLSEQHKTYCEKPGINIGEIIQILGIDQLFMRGEDKELLDSHSFSGGELQRINLFAHLLSGEKLILFDEAFSAIDLNRQNEVISFLRKNGYYGIIITHSDPKVEFDTIYEI